MPSYIRDRAADKEAYLRSLASRASAGVATTTPTTSSSTTTMLQAMEPWVPPVATSSTARPLLEQPRQQDAVVSIKFFLKRCINLFVKIVGEMQCTSLPLPLKNNYIM